MANISRRAQEALQRSANAGRRAMARVRERERRLIGTGIGLGAGWVGARWVGRRHADVERGELETADLKAGPVSIPLYSIGLIMAGAGALGVVGDDQYDGALSDAGAAVFGADMALRARANRMAEP